MVEKPNQAIKYQNKQQRAKKLQMETRLYLTLDFAWVPYWYSVFDGHVCLA